MRQTAIELENISKKYFRGEHQPYYSLRDTLTTLFNKKANKSRKNTFWSLKKVSFKIYKGEVVGIIGRNGAGKSTLLKVISRIVPPTGGRATIHGRMASMLEVGTGFHPELTGRENIYLNGAILGMTHKEIKKKLPEIIDFSGIDNFIDTPVKRYSSGMYVRLAFAVAAHLDPDILVVDEVLSVGDAEFQKKSLGKIESAASDKNKTVLFVSHNLTAIRNICSRCIWLESGQVKSIGPTNKVISKYLRFIGERTSASEKLKIEHREGTKEAVITSIQFRNKLHKAVEEIISGEDLEIVFKYKSKIVLKKIRMSFNISTEEGTSLFLIENHYVGSYFNIKKGVGSMICNIPHLPLNQGNYLINYRLESAGKEIDYPKDPVIRFQVTNGDFYGTRVIPLSHSPMLVMNHWRIEQ